ncbi:glycoside hydrolase family 88 protein [Paenibacillus sp. sptzw28]|uniref:glycoside hydrolase family 88/105 protein n=1 Tax=Paenibacillus sp. sptzw28 TaxID=715179 RepID=UPI001C6F1E36|nr:glycoside hydrolase family 88 protein [Paenibacillus sp. sptzw28]QYR23596.1 glycoside hydrolase family 88 protein [Paenibacillus sp. sptzw28]
MNKLLTGQASIGWAQKTAETIVNESDNKGYHSELAKRWAYVPGMMLMALGRTGEQYGIPEYSDFMKRHMDLFVREDGTIYSYSLEEYNLDQINQGKNLFTLMKITGESRYEKAAHLLAAQLLGHPRTSGGGLWHKKVYPFQMWLDGLYMAMPFLAQYAKTFERPQLFDEVAHQLLLVEQKTRDPKTGLLYHGWDESKEQIWADPVTGCSQNFWSRAMGWYAMAIVDSLEHFPVDHPKRGTIIGIFERMCHSLCRVQERDSGLWFQVLDQGFREGNYLEASGSSMFVYAMAKGLRLRYLSGNFHSNAVRGYQGILDRLVEEDESGVHLHSICHGAGLSLDRDGTYGYYIREQVVSDAHMGMAPFLLASLEMERYHAAMTGEEASA